MVAYLSIWEFVLVYLFYIAIEGVGEEASYISSLVTMISDFCLGGFKI